MAKMKKKGLSILVHSFNLNRGEDVLAVKLCFFISFMLKIPSEIYVDMTQYVKTHWLHFTPDYHHSQRTRAKWKNGWRNLMKS